MLLTALAWAQASQVDQSFTHALELHRSGDLKGAAREYRAVLAADPTRVDARSNLGAVLANMGRYAEAIEQYRLTLRAAPPAAAVHLRVNLALAYYKSFQIVEARDELSRLYAEHSADLNATMLLADCHLRLGEYKQVIELLTPLEPEPSNNRAIPYMLGMAYIRDGQVAAGQQRLDRILRDGDSAEGRFLLATGFLMAKDFPSAVKAFARAIELNPNLPSLQSFYGMALLATGDADAAAQAFRNELAANPNDYDANFQLASILAHRRQFEAALPLLGRAVEVRPGAAEARAALSNALQGKGPPSVSTGGVRIGAMAPGFTLAWHGLPGRMALSEFRGRKPVVLVFGSYTCPNFRSQAGALNALYDKYHDQVAFALIYIREAHSAGQWQSTMNEREGITMQPARDISEKHGHAGVCLRKLKIRFPAAVDGLDGKVETAYEGWPSRAYLVSADGRIAFNRRLGELDFDPAELEAAIRKELSKRVARR